MEITFDPAKNESNFAKHGVELAIAAEFDWSEVMAYVDARRDYREVREIGFGLIGDRLYCVVFVQRGESFHIISLRKANNREQRIYAEYD